MIIEHFDILFWWKLNANQENIVSQIVKDVLRIQISTVASKSTSSTSGRIFDSFKSLLSAKMIGEVIRNKNLFHINKEPRVICQYLDEVEVLDDLEKDV